MASHDLLSQRNTNIRIEDKAKKKKQEEKRQREVSGFERELIQAEGRAAGPFGTPGANRKRRAAGESFAPAKGAVSAGAQAFASQDRTEAKTLLSSQVAAENKGKGGKTTQDLTSDADRKRFDALAAKKDRRKRQINNTLLGSPNLGTKKLGV